MPVRPEDVHKTVVVTPFGLFDLLCLPFGLRNAGQTFQHMMDEILAGLDYCFVYLDVILVASKIVEEHEVHLREVHLVPVNGELPGPRGLFFRHQPAGGQGGGNQQVSAASNSSSASDLFGVDEVLSPFPALSGSGAQAADQQLEDGAAG